MTGAGPDARGRIMRAVEGVLRLPKPGVPVVTLSWAQSAAGAIARADGTPLALSGRESMVLTHRMRAAHDAILVGIQTVISDNPLLSVRLLPSPPPPYQPQPVVLDSRLRFPPGARLLAREDRKPWIFYAEDTDDAGGNAAALSGAGARLFRVGRGPGGLDLFEMLQTLGVEGIRSLMVEGGARVLRAFMTAGFVEQVVVTVSPSTVQGLPGPGMPGFVESLTEVYGPDSVTWGTLNP
jgi:riboflavin-specific deaminase-like protein